MMFEFYLNCSQLLHFPHKTLHKTHTHTVNSDTRTASEGYEKEGEEDEDLFSGAKEAEAYQQSKQVRKSIQEMLGRRAGPRWSLPHQYIG